MSEKSRRPHLTAIVLAVALAAAAGAICTALVIAPIVPPSLSPADEPAEVPITVSAFSDPLPVTLVLDAGQAVNIVSPMEGRVTAFSCARGASLTSGGTSLAVDGSPLLTLASSIPPWRSLEWGDSGSDVEAIRTELLRLGAPASTPGELDSTDTAAYDSLLTNIGAESGGDSIELGSILWTPQDGAMITSCSTSIGELVSAGQIIATLAAPLTRVTVTDLPATVRDGARELVLDDTRTPIALIDGSSAEQAVVAAVQRTASYQELLPSDGDTTQLPAKLSLVVPLEVSSVPAGSIFGIDGAFGCVVAAGGSIPVEILGSQLGQTYVSFVGGKPPARIQRDPDKETECP